MSHIFISYAREDIDFVRVLHSAFDKISRDVWVDWEGIPPTAEWFNEIRTAIEAADAFVFIISPDSIRSEVCNREISHAIEHNKRLVPILRRKIPAEFVPEVLSKLNWLYFRDSDDFQTSFQKLVQAIDTDLDWVGKHTRLLVRALEWERNGYDNSFVLHGRDLRNAEAWLASAGEKDPQPTSLQRQYVTRGRKVAIKRRRLTIGALVLGLVVVAVVGTLALFQRSEKEQQSQIALARRLAAQSLTYLHSAPDLALLLAVEASRIHDTLEARGSLLDALEQGAAQGTTLFAVLRDHDNWVMDVDFAPTGGILASASADTRIVLWDVAAQQPVAQLDCGRVVRRIAFSPNGMLLAAGLTDGDVLLWDVEEQQIIKVLDGHLWDVRALAFSPDGQTLASGGDDGQVLLWDMTAAQYTGVQLWEDAVAAYDLAFSHPYSSVTSMVCLLAPMV